MASPQGLHEARNQLSSRAMGSVRAASGLLVGPVVARAGTPATVPGSRTRASRPPPAREWPGPSTPTSVRHGPTPGSALARTSPTVGEPVLLAETVRSGSWRDPGQPQVPG